MSLIGAILGVLLALGITPVVERMSVRVELSVSGAVLSLAFGEITGTIFGFYPAYKASTPIPVVSLESGVEEGEGYVSEKEEKGMDMDTDRVNCDSGLGRRLGLL